MGKKCAGILPALSSATKKSATLLPILSVTSSRGAKPPPSASLSVSTTNIFDGLTFTYSRPIRFCTSYIGISRRFGGSCNSYKSCIPRSLVGTFLFSSTITISANLLMVGVIPTPEVGTISPLSVTSQASITATFIFPRKP